MLLELALCSLALLSILPAAFNYVELRQWWTLRLKISCSLPWRVLTAATIFAVVTLLGHAFLTSDLQLSVIKAALAASSAGFAITVLRFLLPLVESREYVSVRWKAWSGPSRTGVPFHLSKYMGDEDDWRSLHASVSGRLETHPVEQFLALASPFTDGMVEDPTDLLTARLAADEDADTVWLPRSDAKAGAYAPSSESDRAVSLLWGCHLGFRPRCSRGIISVATRYLSFKPILANGLDARPICLAHGILARNKGLEPQKLVCNLFEKQSFRAFEENSVLWPRPAKTLRSFYREEFAKSFSGLGEAYITAATELALLISDMKYHVLEDWLEGAMEHQDIRLNNRIAELGATAEELYRLYRGHYAAMLASLSLHRPGLRTRPELLVFERLSLIERVEATRPWLASNDMSERMAVERDAVGPRGLRLIDAIV